MSTPENDDVSPYESVDSKKLNEAAERALDFHFPSIADIKAAPRTPSSLFSVDPEATTETLVVFLVETLASVDVMVHQLVDHLEGGSRYALLGISNSIMVAEITANRVLDNIDVPKPAPHRSHRESVFAFCFSPLNRPSVSSPAACDLDPPAPSGG